MEYSLVFSSYQFHFTFLLFLFMLIMKIAKWSKANNFPSNLPPGPRKLPLIGNMHQMIGSLPHRSLRNLAIKYGPLMHLQLGELSVIVISSAETAKEVMKTHDLIFANRPYFLVPDIVTYGSTDIAFAPYGAYWRQLRKIFILELLSTKRVQSFRPVREEEVSNFIKSIFNHTGSPVNLTEKIFSLTFGITSRAAFGKKCKEQEEFISFVKELVVVTGGFNIADLFPSVKMLPLITGIKQSLEKLHVKIDRILDNIIVEHKARRAAKKGGDGESDEDLVDVLLKVQEDGNLELPLTLNNIKAVILDVFSAGTETSSTVVDWTMAEMLKNPRVMKKAQAEVRKTFNKKGHVDEADLHELIYMKLVIKEIMRLHHAVPLLLPRENSEKCEINGYEIPVKSQVIVNAWAIGRDPETWTDAESFNPERLEDSSIDYKGTNFEYIPFGAGRRICPGISFGLANVELPLANLLYHFDWGLADGKKFKDLEMTEVFGISVRRKRDLYVIPIPYRPSPVE